MSPPLHLGMISLKLRTLRLTVFTVQPLSSNYAGEGGKRQIVECNLQRGCYQNKWLLLASLLEASPAPLEASFRALVRQSEAMSSFVMERDALCASDRVSLWKITLR